MKRRFFSLFFIYIVAANITLWIASQVFGLLIKGLFDIEFVIIGILSAFLRRTLIVGLLLVAILLDLFAAICRTYLLSPSDLLRNARFFWDFAPSHLWEIAAITVCIAAICLAATLADRRRPASRESISDVLALGVFIILCGVVDITTKHTELFRQDSFSNSLRLTRTPTHELAMGALQHGPTPAMPGTNARVASASGRLVGFDPGSRSLTRTAMLPNLVLVLVESWGKPLAADIDEALVRPYSDNDVEEKYSVSRGSVPFYGPTVDGEARELCGSAIGFGVLTASAADLKGCLPAKLHAMGYRSMAVHGFSSRMFDRGEWYSRMGFDETWFREQFQQQGLPRCPGPLPGTCDAAISAWIGDQLQRSSDSAQFIYWVTLNSHLPVPIPNLVEAPPPCSSTISTAKNPPLCSWYQLEFNVHRSVAELAKRSTARPTIFVIVGDHAPPFSSSELRSEFSNRVVPYILLMPKTNGSREAVQAIHPPVVATHEPAKPPKLRLKKDKIPSHSPAVG